jgi:hypothetical protein
MSMIVFLTNFQDFMPEIILKTFNKNKLNKREIFMYERKSKVINKSRFLKIR